MSILTRNGFIDFMADTLKESMGNAFLWQKFKQDPSQLTQEELIKLVNEKVKDCSRVHDSWRRDQEKVRKLTIRNKNLRKKLKELKNDNASKSNAAKKRSRRRGA